MIESTFTRIADALERIATVMESGNVPVTPKAPEVDAKPAVPPAAPPAAVQPEAAAPVVQSPPAAPTAPPAAPAPAAPAPQAPAASTVAEVNAVLVENYHRLGGTPEVMQQILAVLKAEPFNATGVSDLKPEQYGAVIAAVQAL